jgi:hypothetical protein
METSQAVEVIVQILGPYIGETMARSATQAHCEKLGIAAGSISPEEAEALLGKLSGGLNIFLGREKAAGAIAEVRTRLRASEEGR